MTTTTKTKATPNAKQTPTELREELTTLSAAMRNDPLYPQLVAHIAVHDAAGENKPLQWVLDACDADLDPMRNARMIRTAHKVFVAIVATIEAQAIIEELEAARTMVVARDAQLGHVLNGWVAHVVTNPGDLTRPNKRAELTKAIEKAHKVFETVDKINAKVEQAKAQVSLFERVLACVKCAWDYKWDVEMELDESRLELMTSDQQRAYAPWKAQIITDALAAVEEGTLETFLRGGKTHGLTIAIEALAVMLKRADDSLFDEDHELRKQFEAILKGDEKKVTTTPKVTPKSTNAGHGSKGKRRTSPTKAKRTKSEGTPASRGEVGWREKQESFPVGKANAQGGIVDRGVAVPHAGLSHKEKAAKGIKG